MEKQIKIFIENTGQIVFASQKSILLGALLENRVQISHSCGGNGTCGTCRVFVTNPLAELPDRSELEEDFAKDRGYLKNERLACQLELSSDIKIKIP